MRFLLFMAAVAWGIAAFAAYTAVRSSLARSWPAVQCVIIVSRTDEVSEYHPYVFQVSYRYSWAGKLYHGRKYQEDYSGSFDLAEADRLTRAFPIGSHRVCYVNPRNPSEAVLEHDNVWIPAFGAAAMILGGAYFAGIFVLTRASEARNGRFLAGLDTGPVAYRRATSALTGPLLMIMGLLCYVTCFGLPLGKGLRSLGWREVPCVIQSGMVRKESHGGLFTVITFWPDVVYRYEVGGVTYRSNTYNASAVGSPWYYGTRGVVHRHPAGMSTICYVNPADPSEAVLDRTPSGTQWFGVWPLVMTLLGGCGIIYAVTGWGDTLGTPRLWGTLALGVGTTSALTVVWITCSDLLQDWNDGVAEWPEYLAVAVAAILSVGLTCGWVLLAVKHAWKGPSGGTAIKLPIVWDREIDRLPSAKERHP